MANNYEYIVAGLPQLTLDFETKGFQLEELFTSIRQMLSKKDNRQLDWLLAGLEPKNMNSLFYAATRKVSNSFISGYFSFDLEIRNIVAAYTARQYDMPLATAVVGNSELTQTLLTSKAEDFDLKNVSEYAGALHRIMQVKEPLEREQQLDRLRWEKANELATFHYFDIDVILAFLLKATIVARWDKLDKETGTKLFKTLVDEVKGTYKAQA